MKNQFTAALRLLACFVLLWTIRGATPYSARAAGVTIITHGFSLDESYATWVTAMAQATPARFHARFPDLDTNFSIYKLTLTNMDDGIYYFTPSRTDGEPPSSTASGEIVIELDWSAIAGLDDYSTYEVADAVADILMATNSFPELDGRPAMEFPIHLIGHSRGGSLMAQLSYDLGTNGIWVDHLTTLDPYPLNNDGNLDPLPVVDAPAEYTYSTVLFADNEWQDLGAGALFGDPVGEPVSGAYVRQLSEVGSGGYWNQSATIDPDHENVHLWYHGTVDLQTPTSDSIATITDTERETWWVTEEQKGTNAGFEYSLIGGGNRMSLETPLGAGSPAIVDGYNQWWDFGAGTSANRTILPSNNGTWPNLIKFNVTGTNVVSAGDSIETTLYYQYAGDSNVTLSIYFDDDFNPYNTNSVLTYQAKPASTGAASVTSNSITLSTANIPAGVHSIYGEISDGVHTRYLYTPELVEIVPNQPPLLGIVGMSDTQIIIGVSGVSGQTIVVQSSPDLLVWSSLATNTSTTANWNYTNNVSGNVGQQFYRALVLP